MEMKKMMDVRDGQKVYFLGLDADGDEMWLEAPSWRCGWYWSIGYIRTYRQTRDMTDIGLFDYLFPNWESFVEGFNDSPFTKDEKWSIYEDMKELYTLRKYADMMHYSRAGIAEGTKTLKKEKDNNAKEYERINNILIPNVWKELEGILI